MATRIRWDELTAPELKAICAKDPIVIIPCGSIEQHGPHLPVQVDSLTATTLAEGAAALMTDTHPTLVTPTLWCGLAEHHMPYGGTFTFDLATYAAVLRQLVLSLKRHGVRRIAWLNGHGGNHLALQTIAGELTIELDLPIAVATYWVIPAVAKRFTEILEKQQNVGHACEAETGMLLHLKPDLVRQETIAEIDCPPDASGLQLNPYHWRSMVDLTPSGVLGVPAAGTAEKGAALMQAATEGVAEALLTDPTWT